MADIFLKIVNMSISACWIVLAIILLRIVLKKSPKWINCVLWGLAGLRLVLPFSFESVFSLIPSAETITKTPDSPRPHIDSGVTIIDNQVNDYLQGNYFEGVTRPMGNFVDISTILAIVWIVGIAALLIYTIISFLRLKGKIGTAVLLRDNIYQSEAVVSPFVLGIIKPKIYLPFNMNGQDMDHVIAHEQAHIRRKDYLWKPLGFLILTLHWFNPMVWFGYILLCRDIELACDEKVIKELNNEQRADYSEALLACSVNRRMIAACPLAFGEVGVKNRIKSVLNYKKPAFWAIVVSVILCVVLAVGFLTNPVNSSVYNGRYETGKCLYNYVVSADKETKNNDLVFDITSDGKVYKTFGDGTTDELGVLKESDYTAEDLEAAMKNQDEKLSIGSIRNAYELSDYIFLQKSNGTVYLVQFFSDGRIMSVFKLNRIGKSDMPNFSGVEKLTWSYNPSLSHTSHYTRTFAFDCEYTHADATCTGGEFWNLEAEGQPRDTNMRFEKGKTVYWTPGEGDGKSADKSEVTLTVYNGESKVQQHTVIFECVSRNYSAGDEYEFYLKDTAEFVLVYSEDGYLTFVERSSIGGVDGPSNVIVSTTIDELKVKYPQFFNVSTDGGLTVYIWQMSANNYSCYLANTSMEAISDNSFAYETGATMQEMRTILTTYDISKENISIQPVKNPLCSYSYTIDTEYREKIKSLFWAHILEVEPTTNSEAIPFPLGSFENPYNIGDSARIKHGDINQKDVVYDYNASITLILTGKEAEEKLKEISSNFEEEKEILEKFDLYLARVHIKYNEESSVKDRLPTAIGVTAVSGDRQLQFIDPRFNITENSSVTADGEYYGWFPVLASKAKDTYWLSITTGTYQGAPGIISGVCFTLPPEENTTEFSGFSYIYRCDDTSHTEHFGNGKISLPEFPASIKLKNCGFVCCDDGCEAEEIINRAIQGFARVYYIEADGELEGKHKILKFKMTVPEPMIESLQKQNSYADILAELERNHYYLIPFGETYYAYIHLEGDDEAFADSIAKNAEALIALP